jgi:hypothetical protein
MAKITKFGQVYENVYNLSKRHVDRHVDTRAISFDDLESMNIDGVRHTLKPIAQQEIANRLGIPIQYLRKCPADVQKFNMNHWIQKEKNESLFVRFDEDDVRAVFTPRYVPTDNLEVLDRLIQMGFSFDTPVQASIDDSFMMLNIPDGEKSFAINGDKMTPGISVSNSEVGTASLSVSCFVMRLICSNGLISKTAVSASYRHISSKILEEFPNVLNDVGRELHKQRHQLTLSVESRVENPSATIDSFNRQFQLNDDEKAAVAWAMPLEYGQTMFNVVNVFTKAAQYQGLPSASSYKLERVGGQILEMVK